MEHSQLAIFCRYIQKLIILLKQIFCEALAAECVKKGLWIFDDGGRGRIKLHSLVFSAIR